MQNLSQMHRRQSLRGGDTPALHFRRDGVYTYLTWSDYRKQADAAAMGLIKLGVEPQDRIGILSENRFEWLIADHAILSAGAVDVPMHAPLAPQQVQYQLGNSGARGVIVSNQAQADKVAEVVDDLPDLEWIVSFEQVTVAGRAKYVTWKQLQDVGDESPHSDEISKREDSLSEESLATIIYTSGTTGNPKGVMLSHGNLLSNAQASLEVNDRSESDLLMSWLPYSHIYARTVDHYTTTLGGMPIALAVSIDSLIEDIQAVQPVWMTGVPRFYEKVWMSVEQLDAETRAAHLKAIFGPNLQLLKSGGAPLPGHVCQGFIDSGVLIVEGYGLTESSPVISFNSADAYRVGSVGQAIPGVEIRIADDGEILTRGPHVMQGYWNNPAATAETIVDGWLHTGDVGELDNEGYLTITDRKKDLIVTSGGKNVAPSEIERAIVADPFIDQAVAYGDGRKFVSALIVPNMEALQSKIDELKCDITGDGEFLVCEPVEEFLQQRVDIAMEAFSQPERVRRCLVLSRPFSIEDDELTATLKVRRRHVIAKYQNQLDALYE